MTKEKLLATVWRGSYQPKHFINQALNRVIFMKHPSPRNYVSAIELLEPRIAPATILVTTLDDSGEGSLRQAIHDSHDTPDVDIIKFAPDLAGTITLTTEITIKDDVIIKGNGAIVISGNHNSQIFNIDDSDQSE